MRRLWQHGGPEGTGTVADPWGLREQGAGRLVSRFSERRVLEAQILGADEEGV